MAVLPPLTVTINSDTPAIQAYIVQVMAAAWDRSANDSYDRGFIDDDQRVQMHYANPYKEEEDV